MPHYMYDRYRKLSGIQETKTETADSKHQRDVDWLIKNKEKTMVAVSEMIYYYVTSVQDSTRNYVVCQPEGACTCPANSREVCKHVEAAAVVRPVTMPMLQLLAEQIKRLHGSDEDTDGWWLKLHPHDDGSEQLYVCGSLLADDDRQYFINVADSTCTCYCYAQHEVCGHLLAASDIESINMTGEQIACLALSVLDSGEEATLSFTRRPRFNALLDTDIEPLGSNMNAELAELNCIRRTAVVEVSNPVIAEANAACDRLKEVLKRLTDGEMKMMVDKVEQLTAEAVKRVPRITGSTVVERRKKNSALRQPGDRVTKPLFNRGGSSSDPTIQAEDGEAGALVGVRSIGAPRTGVRGLGGLIRSSTAGGLRSPSVRNDHHGDDSMGL